MSFLDELAYKTYDDVDEDIKEMDTDEIAEELKDKLKEYESCLEYEDKWYSENDEDALDTDFCENAGYIAELSDEIADLIVAYKEKDEADFSNKFPEIDRLIDEDEMWR